MNSDIERIEPAFRLLLTNDGTLTDMLQVIRRETIHARILFQEVRSAGRSIDPLDLGPGELVLTRRVKEVTAIAQHAAGSLSRYFGTADETPLPTRTCRVFAGSRPVMLITEHFSPSLAGRISNRNQAAEQTSPGCEPFPREAGTFAPAIRQ